MSATTCTRCGRLYDARGDAADEPGRLCFDCYVGELKPFRVQWEARSRGGFNQGLRRVFAKDERVAALIAPALIARENAWPEGVVQVLDVRAIEP